MTPPQLNQPTKVPVGRLRLDRENPRLKGAAESRV